MLSLSFATRPSLAEAQKDVWVAKETNQFLGMTNMYISPDGCRCIVRDGELSIICAAPSWNVVMYRKSDDAGVMIPYQQFCEHGLRLLNPKLSLRKGGTVRTVFDPALKTQCKELTIVSDRRYIGSDDPMVFRATKKRGLKEVRYKCTEGIPLDPKVELFLDGLFNVPRTFVGIPLELAYYLNDGSVEKTYSTYSVKKSRVPKNFFDYPNFKNRADVSDLMISNKQKDQFQDLLESVVQEESDADQAPGAKTKSDGGKAGKWLDSLPKNARLKQFFKEK